MATAAELVSLIIDDVSDALNLTTPAARTEALSDLAAQAFMLAVGEEIRADTTLRDEQFVASMDEAFADTDPDGTPTQVERVANVIAVAAVNAAALSSAAPGSALQWNTQRDDRVRELHRPLDGEVRAVGDPFDVGGAPLLYPGQPVGPPEGWINCRCYLTPAVTASVRSDQGGEMADTEMLEMLDLNESFDDSPIDPDVLVAVSDKPWSQFSASDYSIEQWRRACLLKMPGGDPDSKSTYKLPVREPSGALNRNGVHAAAGALGGARGGVSAPPEAKASARRKLRGLYSQLGEKPPESLAAVSAPGTHDAPGWITNPRETQRLRTYWTKGEGAAKIRWGQPGDFDRCRRQLRKYVTNPEWLAGTCANLHFVALGFWPGQGPHASGEPVDVSVDPFVAAVQEAFEMDDELTAAAVDFGELPPLAWFEDPALPGPTPMTIDADGHVYGHIATFEQCHLGYDQCVVAPRSQVGYAHFRTGAVRTTGGIVSVGNITMDTGHADKHLPHRETVAHYDDTGTVVADIAVGEDDYGIWFNGQMRPGIPPDKVRALQAATVSPDWRNIGGRLEFVAALAVNVPGYGIPRPELVAALDGTPLTLVAAAIVTVDPNAAAADTIAELVVSRLSAREARARRAKMLQAAISRQRVAALVAAAK